LILCKTKQVGVSQVFRPRVAASVLPLSVAVKPCQHDVDAHAFLFSFRQPCRFRSRLQAQRESCPEGAFAFSVSYGALADHFSQNMW
jgi:hypothetical protein